MEGIQLTPLAMRRRWRMVLPAWHGAAAYALIALATVLRLVYLAYYCPLDLSPDEAHYWDWSRHLDWSYYSKGPLVAWIIRLCRELLGDSMFAVRFPAVLFSAGSILGLHCLTRRVLQSDRLALGVVAVAMSLPVMSAGGALLTIDAPFCFCWTWALVLGHVAIFDSKAWAWPLLGLTIGAGILAKYTMVLWLPLAGIFLIVTPQYRVLLRQRGPYVAACVAAVCCLPILIWNVQHDWITLRHVEKQAGAEAVGIRWLGPLRFVSEQAALLLVYWYVCWVGGVWRSNPLSQADTARKYIWWLSVPVFAAFLLVSFKTPGQINWAIVAYIGGLILGIDWLAAEFATAGFAWRRILHIGLSIVAITAVFMSAVLHFPGLIRPVLVAVSGKPTVDQPTPLRRFDPTARLRGWQSLASAVDEELAKLRSGGEDALIATSFWTLPGELAFYCKDHPDVCCFGPPLRQRLSQYDLWRPNPVWDPEKYQGRTFIFVGDVAPEVVAAFERVESTRRVEYTESGHVLAFWNVTIARGFRGFGPPDVWPGGLRY